VGREALPVEVDVKPAQEREEGFEIPLRHPFHLCPLENTPFGVFPSRVIMAKVGSRSNTKGSSEGGERRTGRSTRHQRRQPMTEQRSPNGFDFEVMRRAVEQLDADLLLNLYADDAELRVINGNSTPSSPREIRGKEEITEYLRDVCGRAMTHRIEREVLGEDRVAFNEECEYPDGTRVTAATTLEVKDGKIVGQVNVEAWDE
jgi:hypothetical protein